MTPTLNALLRKLDSLCELAASLPLAERDIFHTRLRERSKKEPGRRPGDTAFLYAVFLNSGDTQRDFIRRETAHSANARKKNLAVKLDGRQIKHSIRGEPRAKDSDTKDTALARRLRRAGEKYRPGKKYAPAFKRRVDAYRSMLTALVTADRNRR